MRDMTKRQFEAALRRHEFKHAGPFGIWFADTSGCVPEGYNFGSVVNLRTGKLCRRDTIRHLIQQRDKRIKETKATNGGNAPWLKR